MHAHARFVILTESCISSMFSWTVTIKEVNELNILSRLPVGHWSSRCSSIKRLVQQQQEFLKAGV